MGKFEVNVPLPGNLTVEMAAKAFTAHLLAEKIYDSEMFDTKYRFQYPPFYIRHSDNWKLDVDGKYWLKDNQDGTVTLSGCENGELLLAITAVFRLANK